MFGGSNGSDFRNAQQIPLAVQPLNSIPYRGSSPHPNVPVHNASFPAEVDAEPTEKVGPCLVILDSNTTQKEWDNVLIAAKSAVALAGSAAKGMFGPVLGSMDIGESDDSYLFRVALPGVSNDDREFRCDIEPDGKIHIRGVTTTGEEIVHKNSREFKMKTQNLCPLGQFSITFQLPGPVDHKQFSGHFGSDGMLEGIVKKI